MKKILYFVLFSMLFCNALNAQPPGVSGFRLYERDYRISIGPKAGAGLALGTSIPMYDFKASMGMSYQAGVAVNAHFGRRQRFGFGGGGTGWFAVEAEALYGLRNFKLNGTPVRMHCLEVPLLAQLYPIKELGIEAGATMVKVFSFTPDVMQSDYALDLRYNFGLSGLAGNFDSKISSVTLSLAYMLDVLK